MVISGHISENAVKTVPVSLKTKPPPLFRVILVNDDFTPMNFVVDLLCLFFGYDQERAERLMWIIHTEGRGECGVYTKDVAESKAKSVRDYALFHQHPLRCIIEESK